MSALLLRKASSKQQEAARVEIGQIFILKIFAPDHSHQWRLNGRTNSRRQSLRWYYTCTILYGSGTKARGILLLVSARPPIGRDYETVIKFTRGLTILQTDPSAYVRTRVIYLKNINWHLK